ncbi:MAG: gliding motility-associated C-terminal domain-containing protein [Bacteroidia bacterium]|nr:gliding motility-associated C-terminal domain-containing protein [Bacteroidia bacterium]
MQILSNNYLRYLYTIFLIVFLPNWATASHNLAGQITYKKVGMNTFEILLTTYTDPIAQGVDRCSADLEIWGFMNGQYIKFDVIKDIPRENGPTGSNCSPPQRMGIFVRSNIKKNYYRTTYTFNGPGKFSVRYFDLARKDNIINMDRSGSTAFYLETILYNPISGDNNSPILLNDPLDDACTGRRWTHNPGAYDPDGDSLAFSLIPCQQYDPDNGINTPIQVANYRYPNAFGGTFTIDPYSGLITWNTPVQVGLYNISILIEEFRNGRLVGHIIRDMGIIVGPCNNDPPIINAPTELCSKPGQSLVFNITTNDINLGDSVYLYLNNGDMGNNGPFQVPIGKPTMSPPLEQFPVKGFPVIAATFRWDIFCEHIQISPYQLDFYAHDNLLNHYTLADNKVTRIRIVPPSTQLIQATTQPGHKIKIVWKPNPCSNAIGYDIYRSTGISGHIDTTCCTNTALSGYEKVGQTDSWADTSLVDDNNGNGLDYVGSYCYRVVSIFPQNQPSCASEPICVELQRDAPILVTNSVISTDESIGSIQVAWARPDTTIIDSIFFPKPYYYQLFRANGITGGTLFPITSPIINWADTVFFDPNLNTKDSAYKYQVKLFDSNNNLIANSNQASSVYLKIAPADKSLVLEWNFHTPWAEDSFQIWRKAPGEVNFSLIQTVDATRNRWLDSGLMNGATYCYFIKSYGKYGVSSIRQPLINDSNETCGVPIDLTPPCLPVRDSFNMEPNCTDFTVDFWWPNSDSSCASDLDFYSIYFSRNSGGPYTFLKRVTEPKYLFSDPELYSIAGCFVITATDTVGNESPYSAEFCVDNCPDIIFPNVFTPNGDGRNDYFIPIKARSVKSIRLQIFDRWGVWLSSSNNINNLWDGTYHGKDVPEGVYYWIADVEFEHLETQKPNSYRGVITLLR